MEAEIKSVEKQIKSATSSLSFSSSSLSSSSDQPINDLESLKNNVEEKTSSWDVARTGRFFAFGVMMAPLLAEWNKFIEFRFPLRTVSGGASSSSIVKVSMAALAKRVSVDQLGL